MFGVTNKHKIINDPVLGFITIPNELIYELVQHPLFQRLTRIKQLGLANVVYPGAQHTRFQHSLGAMHLVGEAVKQLRLKGQMITAAEENGVLAAMLLHDIGHGPFSHVLEYTIISGVSHEELGLKMMEQINEEIGGRLSLAIKIFKDEYEKRFLHQLISSQLDMDRMDDEKDSRAAKIVCACPRCVYKGRKMHKNGRNSIVPSIDINRVLRRQECGHPPSAGAAFLRPSRYERQKSAYRRTPCPSSYGEAGW